MVRRPSITVVSAFVAMGVVVLAAAAYEGVDATRELLRDQHVSVLDDTRTRYDCLAQGFRNAVPEGTRVLLRTAARDDETLQRLVESTYPDYEYVERRADADLVVNVRPGRACRPRIAIEAVR